MILDAARPPHSPRPGFFPWLAAAAFLLSGAAGLVYQVAWQRILALHSGVGMYSIAMIVAAFMCGLGVGSHLGGLLSLRFDARGSVRAFAAVEILIGLFGAVSPWLYYDVLYVRGGWLYEPAWRAGLLHFAGLFVPTCLMGMSLPLLVRGVVKDVETASRTVGVLYAVNLLGASLGALITPWVLVRHLGIAGAVLCAAGANVTAGLLGLQVRPRQAAIAVGSVDAAPLPAPSDSPTQSFALWTALYAAGGFMALSLEVLWFRILELAVKATAFTFGTMLCLYLLGMSAGCFIGVTVAGRLQRPLRAFLLCQTLLLVYSGVVIVLLARVAPGTVGYDWFFRYWSTSLGFKLGEAWELGPLLRLYGVFPVLLYGLPTVLMGLSFPILQRAVQDDPRTSGRKVGLLQAANIAGCVAGSLLVGLLTISLVGTTGSLRLLMASGVLLALVGARTAGGVSFPLVGVTLAALALLIPSQEDLWRRLHGTESSAALVEEDATGVAAIVPDPKGPWRVFVTGKHHSWVPFGGMHTQLGAAPVIVHPAPIDVAIIGLGSGDTAWAAGAREETRHITVFEISTPQPRLLRRLASVVEAPELRQLLADPRLHLLARDGRQALHHGAERYDVIEADALWPEVAYSGNLYSEEFFRLCASRLKQGGIMCSWAPTPRIFASFSRVFPHMLGLPNHDVLLGSPDPLAFDREGWRQRLASQRVKGYLGEGHARDVDRLVKKLIPLNRKGLRNPSLQSNHDLFPRDEFLSP